MRRFASLVVAGIVVMLLANAAVAGSLVGDPNAILGWSGSKVMNSTKIPGVVVDYAVYAPGDFWNSAALNTPPDPSAGADPSFLTDFVYAYEVFANTLPVSSLTVGTSIVGAVPLSYVGTDHVNNYTAASGVAPTTEFFNTGTSPSRVTNARWIFSSPNPIPVSPGHSNILYFTSPFGPHFDNASIQGGSLFAVNQLPSPIPEPTTATLSVIAIMSLFAARRLRMRIA